MRIFLYARPFQNTTAVAMLLICWFAGLSLGQTDLREPPAIYREKLTTYLTPLEEILRLASSAKVTDQDGVILLDEELHYIDDTGRRYLIEHRAYKALTDGGAKEVAEDLFNYRKTNQKIYLVEAQTILPDGRRMPVRPEAAILQSPQRQADYALYDDQGELRLIFPDVKPGSITEAIVLIEESRFRVPGEFTAAFSWAYGWPIQRLRRIIEGPKALTARLKRTVTGLGVPEPEVQELAPDRVRQTWQSENIHATTYEKERAPIRQTGPMLWLTTLPDWDALVRWYAPLVTERSDIKPGLKKQIDEWTQTAHRPAEILDILMAKVSNDVRYTGLEFGAADLQPHSCDEVWENQYGDCKDKANLLRAMLQYKGINAWLVLLNADQAGHIEHRSPDYRQFDHAIVAVELEPAQYLFCDPTIRQAKPGMLSPGDTDRDVLVIKNNTADWAHTPRQEAGTLHYDLDLKLAVDGGISGWLTLEADGYYGISNLDYYQKLDRDHLLETCRDRVNGFFKGAEVVDATQGPVEKRDGVFRLKVYFLVPGTNQTPQGKQSLSFPQTMSLFVDPGAQKKRETPFYQWRDVLQITARFQLPEGLTPSETPHPLRIQSPTLDAAARWTTAGNTCEASLDLHTKEALVPPALFESFYNSLQSLHAWLDQPLLIVAAEGKAGAPISTVNLDDFPMMPNGYGQLNLVEKRFPDNGDRSLRREALRKVRQYFPTDKPTLFEAGIKLATMDWEDDQAAQAVDQIRTLLRTYHDSIDIEASAWGEYMLGLALDDSQQTGEALKIMERLSSDQTVPESRRAWACYQRGRMLGPKSTEEAIPALRQGLALDTDAQPSLFTLLAKLLLLHGQIAEFKEELKQLLGRKPHQLAAMLTRLAGNAATLLPREKAAERAELIQALEDAAHSADLGPAFEEALRTTREHIQTLTASDRVQQALKEYLARNPSPPPNPAAPWKTAAEFSRGIDQAEKDSKSELCLAYGLELLTRFAPDADFFPHLWKVTDYADWNERARGVAEPLLPVLLDLCDTLPRDNEAYLEGKFLRAKVGLRHDDVAAAQKIYEELLRDPDLPPGYKVSAHARLAEILEQQHDYLHALETYHAMEAEVTFVAAKDDLLRAALLNLEMGHREEAFRVLDILAGRSPEAIKQAKTGAQIAELTAFTRDRTKAGAYWDVTAQWWGKWTALEEKLGLKPLGTEQVIPAIPDLTDLGVSVGNALRARDRAAFGGYLRVLVHGARWQPTLASELADILNYVPQIAPECADDARRFTVALFENFPSIDPKLFRQGQMHQMISYLDLNESAKALEVIQAYNAEPQPDDPISHVVSRLWAVAVLRDHREPAPAITALEKTIASPNLRQYRAMTVLFLADLYEQAGRVAEEEALLQREMENAQIKAIPADLQAVTARYQRVTEAGSQSQQFSTGVERWLKENQPGWYDYAEPKTLEDPRLSNLDAVLKNPKQIFSKPEIIKLHLLIARSATQPPEQRQESFRSALIGLANLANTTGQTRRIFEPLIDSPDFPEPFRIEALWQAIFSAYVEMRAADLEKLRQHPLAAKLSERTKAAAEKYHDFLAVDQSSPEVLTAFCDGLLEKEITIASEGQVHRVFRRLLALGRVDAAEKIYQRLASANINPEVGQGKTALQMEYLHTLNLEKRWLSTSAALRQIVLAQYPADTIVEPPAYASLHDRDSYDFLDDDVAWQIRLYQIKAQEFRPGDFGFWKSFVRGLKPGPTSRQLAFDLIAAALRNAPGDTERSAATLLCESIDFDEADLYRQLLEILQPYRQAEEAPLTYAQIRLLELRHALRTGQPADVESAFTGLHNSGIVPFANMLKLRRYLQTQDAPALRRTMESINPDDLLSDRLLAYSVRGFEMTKMNDELDLAREAGEKALYQHVLQSWATRDSYDFLAAFALARALHTPAKLPESWVHEATAKDVGTRSSMDIQTHDAYVREDWPRLLQNSEEMIKVRPTFYTYYLFKGTALYHLGRKQEAKDPLQIYVRYARDELDYPPAVAWLKEIEEADKTALPADSNSR